MGNYLFERRNDFMAAVVGILAILLAVLNWGVIMVCILQCESHDILHSPRITLRGFPTKVPHVLLESVINRITVFQPGCRKLFFRSFVKRTFDPHNRFELQKYLQKCSKTWQITKISRFQKSFLKNTSDALLHSPRITRRIDIRGFPDQNATRFA